MARFGNDFEGRSSGMCGRLYVGWRERQAIRMRSAALGLSVPVCTGVWLCRAGSVGNGEQARSALAVVALNTAPTPATPRCSLPVHTQISPLSFLWPFASLVGRRLSLVVRNLVRGWEVLGARSRGTRWGSTWHLVGRSLVRSAWCLVERCCYSVVRSKVVRCSGLGWEVLGWEVLSTSFRGTWC